jgi:hypothetical protein
LSVEECPGLSERWFKHESLVLHLDLHGGHLNDLSVLLSVIRALSEFLDPELDPLLQAINQNVRYSLVKLVNPNLQIGVALDLKDVNDLLNLFDLLRQDLLV